MKNCWNCKFNDFDKCGAGHTDEMTEFKNSTGKMKRSDIENDPALIMNCHDYPDGVKLLDSMIEKTDEMLNLFKDHAK